MAIFCSVAHLVWRASNVPPWSRTYLKSHSADLSPSRGKSSIGSALILLTAFAKSYQRRPPGS
eukprot:6093173-Pyramimonas_sp.AAC.1